MANEKIAFSSPLFCFLTWCFPHRKTNPSPYLVFILQHNIMIYFAEPKPDTNCFEFPVSIVWQVPEMHKLTVKSLSIYLQKIDDKNLL